MTFKEKNKISLKDIILLSIENLFSIGIISIVTASIIGINPATIFLLNSINNILYLILNNFKFPSYMMPNLMLISPIVILMSKYKRYELILGSFIFYGIFFFSVSLVIKRYGFFWLNFIFPPHILGLIMIVMGLDLTNILIQKLNVSNWKLMSIFLFTFSITVLSSIFWNKFLFIPIFIGLTSGYILSISLNIINFKKFYETPWFVLPKIYFSRTNFSLDIFLIIFPIVLVSVIEYISFIIITKKINKDYTDENNSLFKSIFINSFINIMLGFIGSIPSVFYNESIKLTSLNKFNLIVFLTSILFIFISFLGKIFVLIQLIPMQSIIGVSLFMYGIIIPSGIKIIIDSNINLNNFQNIILIFVTLISGISGFKLVYKNIEIKGLVLTIIVGVILNLLFKFINYLNKNKI